MKQLSTSSSLEKMIRQQLVDRGIHDKSVLEAIRKVPREQFFPEEIREQAHADRAAPIGHGQTISQPYIVALMTQHLKVQKEHRVLEIGTGSGYQTAILANLMAEVYTVERVKPLLDDAFERLMSLGYRNVHLHFGDGTMGWPQHAPYDRMLITAGAPELPRALLLSQLKDEGVAVLPVGPQDEQMLVEVRRSGRRLETKDICACRFVKLIGEDGWKEE
ncbi:MAG TPA: protein-L-isoaspartate(D-aspartate) O-methyltransferase [Tepidisphaeraceae bacterium]|jgi:protein-L-isoaspartate(D-aspartate) O-methyltransferase|nr:protein-L-isoaspartate(D-aspartate) O-methyltransferase [Tepidisphaeraceae bacterium]